MVSKKEKIVFFRVKKLKKLEKLGKIRDTSYFPLFERLSINHTLSTINYFNYDGLGSVRQLTDDTEAVVAEYTYDAFGNVIAQTTGGMAYHTPVEDEPINTAGLVLLLCFVSGLGIVTIRSKPIRRIGGRRGILLILVLSTALITISIPTSMAIETDETGNPYGFTGESQFGEGDDLIFLRARYYNPSTGRFISRDPILEPMQLGSNFVWVLPSSIYQPKSLYSYVYCGNNPVNYVDPRGLAAAFITIVIAGVVIIIGAILTINCLIKISKFQNKVIELEKENSDECSTNNAWNRATKTKEYKDMIGACGMPSPGA